MTDKLIDLPRRALAGALLALAVGAVITVAMTAGGPPPPRPASTPAEQFSADRAMQHLVRFATEPRPLGSPAAARTRDYAVERLRAEGFDVRVQRAVGARSAPGLATFGRVDNVVATLPGTASTGTVLLAAHYDSAAMGPGASDDGAAVAAALETARALRASGPLRNDVVVLLTDGEEDGVLGAEAYVRRHPTPRHSVLLNFEARGTGGPSLMFETSRDNAGLVRAFADAAPRPHGDSSMVEIYRALPNNTDFTPLSKAGYRGMNFAYIQHGSHYHTATDSIANLDRGSLQHHGATMLGLARTFGKADIPKLDTGNDVTYFRLPGLMVVYPGALAGVLAGASVLALAGLVAAARSRRLLSLPRTALAAFSAIVPLIVAIVLAEVVWLVLAGVRPAYDQMGGLVHRPVPYRCAVAAITGFALLLWYLPLRRRLGPAALAVGALAWPTGLGVLLAVVAPGAAFLCTLPALGAALGGLGAVLLPRGRGIALGAGVAVPALLLPVWAQAVFDGMGLALAGVPALAIALLGLTLLPIVELVLPAPRLRTTLVVPAAALATSAALIVAGLAFDTFDRTHPRRTHLAYVRDADTQAAHWVSGDSAPPSWTRKLVPVRDTGELPPGYARGPLWTGPAPLVTAAAPDVTVLGHAGDTYKLHVAAGKGARSVTLRFERPITEATAAVPRAGSAKATVRGTRRRTWPGEVRFRGLPRTGAVITVRVPGGGRVTAIAETPGLPGLHGTPRPDGIIPSTREDGDLTAITRTYRLDTSLRRGT
ncbi:M20/M25/M40 family metallo-hydrolase [Spirillospora sp. NPDC048823]|uniref:M20/M25/M40 family metallo-hydrolase n=1 Tax=unclassified Spirillospora TaxID=2642701 RepID=UPI00371419ED